MFSPRPTALPEPSSNYMTEHRIAKLGFEPRAFRRHDSSRISNDHQIFDARGKHGERAGIFSRIHEFLQFRRATDAAHEINPLARARIVDAKQWCKHLL